MKFTDTKPAIFAIVLNYNGADDTKKCVYSLLQSGYANLHIVLVDNASPDGSGDVLAEAFPKLPLLRQQSNTGYGGGNNAGIRYALQNNADFVLIINNDVIVEQEFLQPMVDVLHRDPGIGVVNGKVFYQSQRDQVFSAAGHFSPLLCAGLNKGGTKRSGRDQNLECDVNYVCGVLLLVRRNVFETIGFFKEEYFMYFEDLEFSRRVSSRFRLRYSPQAVAYHKSGSGRGWSRYRELYLYYYTRNRFWVFKSDPWYYRIYVILFSIANAIGKSLAILLNIMRDRARMWRQLRALWQGIWDGLIGKGNS